MAIPRARSGAGWAGKNYLSGAVAVALLAMILIAPNWLVPQPAWAATSEAPPTAPRLGLPYGATYGSPARSHSGLDALLPAGAPARSAVAGTVTFAGLVPATGQSARIGAISVQGPTGSVVTLSPITGASVSVGADVTLGQVLGTVAAAGDGSMNLPHLHLSERVADRYVDPTHLLAGWAAAYESLNTARTEAAQVTPAAPLVVSTPTVAHAQTPADNAPGPSAMLEQAALISQPAPAIQAQPAQALVPAPASVGVGQVAPAFEPTRFMPHPEGTLGAAGQEASISHRGLSAERHAAAAPSQPSPAAVDSARYISTSLRYFGAGLIALAAGLGFALHIAGRSEKCVPSHRMGS